LAPRLAEGTAAPLAAIPPSSNEPPKTYATPTADRETFTARFREASCPLGNTVEFRFFDRRRRDLDNPQKAVGDSLKHARVIRDDSQIDDWHIVRGAPVRGGACVVEITEGSP